MPAQATHTCCDPITVSNILILPPQQRYCLRAEAGWLAICTGSFDDDEEPVTWQKLAGSIKAERACFETPPGRLTTVCSTAPLGYKAVDFFRNPIGELTDEIIRYLPFTTAGPIQSGEQFSNQVLEIGHPWGSVSAFALERVQRSMWESAEVVLLRDPPGIDPLLEMDSSTSSSMTARQAWEALEGGPLRWLMPPPTFRHSLCHIVATIRFNTADFDFVRKLANRENFSRLQFVEILVSCEYMRDGLFNELDEYTERPLTFSADWRQLARSMVGKPIHFGCKGRIWIYLGGCGLAESEQGERDVKCLHRLLHDTIQFDIEDSKSDRSMVDIETASVHSDDTHPAWEGDTTGEKWLGSILYTPASFWVDE